MKQNKGQLFGRIEIDETCLGGLEKNKHASKRTTGAQGRTRPKPLFVPDNLMLAWLPPHSPQRNPQELVWREVRRPPFGNHDYTSTKLVEWALEGRLRELESSPQRIRSLTGFDWIINIRLTAQ